MRIPKDEFVAMHISSPINYWTTWGFVRANYCDAMTAKGLCPKKCTVCEPHLKEAIERTNRKDVKKPIGLLIFALRELVAKMQEELNPERSVERDRYEPQKDPYQDLLEELK